MHVIKISGILIKLFVARKAKLCAVKLPPAKLRCDPIIWICIINLFRFELRLVFGLENSTVIGCGARLDIAVKTLTALYEGNAVLFFIIDYLDVDPIPFAEIGQNAVF